MKKRLLIWGILIMLVFTGISLAQNNPATPETPVLQSDQPLTPNDLFEIALRHNSDHLKTVQNTTLSDVKLRGSWGTLMPALDAGFSISQSSYYNPTYTNPDGTVSTYPRTVTAYQTVIDTTNWTLSLIPSGTTTIPISEGKNRSSSGWISLRETVSLGGQQYFTIKNAQIQNRINALQVSSSEMELYYLVRQSYYNVLARIRLLTLAEQILEQKQELLKLAKARFDVGSVTELDVLQAEIDVGNQQNAVIVTKNNLKIEREGLNQILGVSLESDYPLSDEFEIFKPEFKLEELIRQAMVSRQDFQITQQQEVLQHNLVNIRRGAFLPSLSASLSHTRSENSGANVGFTFAPRNRNTSASLTLAWNLFSGFSDEEQYQQSRVSYKNARHDLKKQEQIVESEVRKAFYALMQTFEQSAVTEKNRDLASKQVALEQERYRLGATPQLNLRAAQVTYEQVENDRITNIFNFRSNLAALERSVGKKLP